jgi:hypothetical protein
MRILKTLTLVLSIYLLAFFGEVVMAISSADYEGGIGVLIILSLLAFMVPKVGYRWFDCFFAAIPFYGIFFIFRIAHRIAFLPERDWYERVSE